MQNLLILEDDEDDFLLLQKVIEKELVAFSITKVIRFSEALEVLEKKEYDVLISTHNPLDSAGISSWKSFLEKISVPVILLAGLDDESYALQLIEQGVQDYLIKGEIRGRDLLRSLRYSKERKKIKNALEMANQRKSDFVAMVAHELRSPLANIQQGLLFAKEGDSETRSRFMEISLKSIDRLFIIVNDLLDLSKIEAGKLELKKEQTDLIPLLCQVIESFQAQFQAAHLTIELKTSLSQLLLDLDPQRVIQVFTNLVGNAFKALEKGGVTIEVIDRPSSVHCLVKDSGSGIKPSELPHIFGKYEQFGKKGTGLGLHLVRQFVEMHGGSITANSTLGVGTTITVAFQKVPILV